MFSLRSIGLGGLSDSFCRFAQNFGLIERPPDLDLVVLWDVVSAVRGRDCGRGMWTGSPREADSRTPPATATGRCTTPRSESVSRSCGLASGSGGSSSSAGEGGGCDITVGVVWSRSRSGRGIVLSTGLRGSRNIAAHFGALFGSSLFRQLLTRSIGLQRVVRSWKSVASPPRARRRRRSYPDGL